MMVTTRETVRGFALLLCLFSTGFSKQLDRAFRASSESKTQLQTNWPKHFSPINLAKHVPIVGDAWNTDWDDTDQHRGTLGNDTNAKYPLWETLKQMGHCKIKTYSLLWNQLGPITVPLRGEVLTKDQIKKVQEKLNKKMVYKHALTPKDQKFNYSQHWDEGDKLRHCAVRFEFHQPECKPILVERNENIESRMQNYVDDLKTKYEEDEVLLEEEKRIAVPDCNDDASSPAKVGKVCKHRRGKIRLVDLFEWLYNKDKNMEYYDPVKRNCCQFTDLVGKALLPEADFANKVHSQLQDSDIIKKEMINVQGTSIWGKLAFIPGWTATAFKRYDFEGRYKKIAMYHERKQEVPNELWIGQRYKANGKECIPKTGIFLNSECESNYCCRNNGKWTCKSSWWYC